MYGGRRKKPVATESSAIPFYTYSYLEKACHKDCLLAVEMMNFDSINDIYIVTSAMIGKQMEI